MPTRPSPERPGTTESGLGEDDFSPVWTDDDRPRIPRVAGEREALAAYLDYYRATVEMKCRGLDFERRDVPFLFISAEDPDLDFNPPADADLAADLECWRAECAVSREIVAAHDLDDIARPLDWHEDVDLRWLVLRIITEYAQHCGHLDLVREGLDGQTGA